MGTISKQQRAVSEETSANTVFLGRTMDYGTERLEESLRKLVSQKDGLLTCLMKKW